MIRNKTKPYRLSYLLIVLVTAQAISGLLFPHLYNDPTWIKNAWFGNDLITLVIIVPLLVFSLLGAKRNSPKATLLWIGMLGFVIYNYIYYLFGASLNAFFLLYITTLILSMMILLQILFNLNINTIVNSFREKTPVRIIGGILMFIGFGLAVVWIAMWAAFIFANVPTPVDTSAFQVVAAIDLFVIVPQLFFGGLLLWQKRPWGYILSACAGILGSTYLLVLTFNAILQVVRGFEEAPGEIPIWGLLLLITGAAALGLIANIKKPE